MLLKKGMMGVGVLLIFISTILVASIAAGVLIRTSGAIGQKAVEVEKVSRERLTTGFEYATIVGYANTTSGTIQNFEIMVRLKPGSSPIAFEDSYVLITMSSLNSKRLNLSASAVWNSNCTFSSLTAESDFCFEALFGNTNSRLEEEELVYLRFKVNSSNAVQPNDDLEIQLIPKVGELSSINLRAPSIKQEKVTFY